MTPKLFTPAQPVGEPGDVIAALASAPMDRPFSPAAGEFCADLSRALFRAGMKDRPEVQALAYWCRPAEVARLKSGFEQLTSGPASCMPRGTVFHIPPVNVETLFLYGWILSILCGNRNIVRISSRASQLTMELCGMVATVLEKHGALGRINLAIQYGHEDQLTSDISACCDLRIVWGGDETVRSLRSVALPPAAGDLCFPDRYSYSVIRAAMFTASPDDQKERLAHAFYNDCYWFDQMACSSPRLIAWCGAPEDCLKARAEFFNLLAREVARRRYTIEPYVRSDKMLFASRLILDEAVDSYETYGTELTVLKLSKLTSLDRSHCGGGLLLSVDVPDLRALAGIVHRRDQTLTYFGFDRPEMESFAQGLNGRGIDRIVPIGEALTFNRFWDGYDLLQELTRRVWVQ
jgi:hypothetical protein